MRRSLSAQNTPRTLIISQGLFLQPYVSMGNSVGYLLGDSTEKPVQNYFVLPEPQAYSLWFCCLDC